MNTNEITAKLEELAGQELDEEQKLEIALWQRGRNLLAIPPHARDEILAMLDEYVLKDADDLLATEPKDKDEVLARHAIAHAASRVVTRFRNDWNTAVDSAQRTPEVVKAGFRKASQMPVDAL